MDLKNRYSSLSTAQLLSILENPQDYRAEALEIAQAELDQRKLGQEELEKIRREIRDQKVAKLRQGEGSLSQALLPKIKAVWDKLNPLHSAASPGEKKVRFIFFFLLLASLYVWVQQFDLFIFALGDETIPWDLSMYLYFLPLFYFPAMAVMVYLRLRLGWILLVAFSCYILISLFALIPTLWAELSSWTNWGDWLILGGNWGGLGLDLILFGGMLALLPQKDVRQIFAISDKTAIISIAAGAGPAIISLIPLD